MTRLRIIISRTLAAGPLILDAGGLGFIAYGVWLLEISRPGIWSIVVGIGLILAGLRAQD